MHNYVKQSGIQVAEQLYQFINDEVLPGSEVERNQFWDGFAQIIQELAPENKALLEKRLHLQTQINEWHKENRDTFQFEKYKEFLQDIGYLEGEVADFTVSTDHVDDEIAIQAGPQLVVPVDNARYAINAANARWGSLYDALYGTDAIPEENGAEISGQYNEIRGQRVVDFSKQFLDNIAPLQSGSHADVEQYAVADGKLVITLNTGENTSLKNDQFIGYNGNAEHPEAILLKNNRLHIEIQIDREHPIGKRDRAGVKDVLTEAALTTIMDCEDSVAAVDAEDKVKVYRNWFGLMKGDLSAKFTKNGKEMTRVLHPDRTYKGADGSEVSLRGRSLMFVRNVGHLMTINAILDQNGEEIPEGILDGVITSLIAKHNIIKNTTFINSEKGSVYIVKPKMHGSEEAAFANKMFNQIEDLIGLKRNTLKIGLMDEERRTSLNLKACIYAVRERIAFINTGFLDRTGDEMHTSMEAGVMIRKNDMKSSTWLDSYEKSNVRIGLAAGLQGRAQIGKGMWAMPDLMAEMLKQKVGHVLAGANTAWVPSPTAATLHAIHYHENDVYEIQNEKKSIQENYLDGILEVPITTETNWSAEEVQAELDNNAQGVLGYVVRWVEQGVGCSKVPDINNVGLMEDRATLRISSQHMANWLHWGICTEEQVLETLKRMAKVVDEQNAGDAAYRPMANNYDESIAFQAACDLVFKGREQPSGYTEPILHKRRLEFKEKVAQTN